VARRTASTSSRSGHGARSSAHARSDGKVDIFCPNCTAQYRVAPEKLAARIECTQCHHVFMARTAVSRRTPKTNHNTIYAALAVGAVLLIASFIIIKNAEIKTPESIAAAAAAAAPPKPQAVDLANDLRAQKVAAWATAMARTDTFGLREYTDLPAVGAMLGIAPARRSAFGHEDVDAPIVDALKTHAQSKCLRDLDYLSCRLSDAGSAKASTGTAMLVLMPRPGTDEYLPETRAEVEVTFRMDGEHLRVTGWSIKVPPKLNPRPTLPAVAAKTAAPAAARTGAQPTNAQAPRGTTPATAGEDKPPATEVTPTALDHLADTPADLRSKIDQAVADILKSADPSASAPGKLFSSAVAILGKTQVIKRAAIPRLLNAMQGFYADVQANNRPLSQLDQALQSLTGDNTEYEVSDSDNPAADKAVRQRAVRRWFALWQRYLSGHYPALLDNKGDLNEDDLGIKKSRKSAGAEPRK